MASSSAKFPVLKILDPSAQHVFKAPAKMINDGPDVTKFLTSKAYRDIGIFVMQLNRAMCPRKVTGQDGKDKTETFQIGSSYETQPVESVKKLQNILSTIEGYISEAPPDEGPRRFGNVSFRTWYTLLEQRAPDLLKSNLPPAVLESSRDKPDNESALGELLAYLLGGFGSSQRLDYGTGHELSFLAFLGCLWKLGAFQDGCAGGDIERHIVLGVFEPYLRVVRKLILTYTLEPAGSHGVWGLDDHSFQPYIYGSAQLTRPITEDDPMPLEGSVIRAPKPANVVKAEYVEEERKRNMYYSAVGFINDVKKGPFWEHSPILFDISGIKDGWGKINKGMIKMFNAEVLSKFPVVQHFPFGSLFSWDHDPDAAPLQPSIHLANQPVFSSSGGPMPPPPPPSAAAIGGGGTAAAWASGTTMRPPPPAGPGGTSRPTVRPSQPQPPNEAIRAQMSTTRAPWSKSSDRPSG